MKSSSLACVSVLQSWNTPRNAAARLFPSVVEDRKDLSAAHPSQVALSSQSERLCCNLSAWTQASETLPWPQRSSGLEFGSFPENCEGLRERRRADAKSSFDDARLAAYVAREVEEGRLSLV